MLIAARGVFRPTEPKLDADDYELLAVFTKAIDFGIFGFHLDGKAIAQRVAFTIARMAAFGFSGSLGQRSTISARSASIGPLPAPTAPDSAPPSSFWGVSRFLPMPPGKTSYCPSNFRNTV